MLPLGWRTPAESVAERKKRLLAARVSRTCPDGRRSTSDPLPEAPGAVCRARGRAVARRTGPLDPACTPPRGEASAGGLWLRGVRAEPPRKAGKRGFRHFYRSRPVSEGHRRDRVAHGRQPAGSPVSGGDVLGAGVDLRTYSAASVDSRTYSAASREPDVSGGRPCERNVLGSRAGRGTYSAPDLGA